MRIAPKFAKRIQISSLLILLLKNLPQMAISVLPASPTQTASWLCYNNKFARLALYALSMPRRAENGEKSNG